MFPLAALRVTHQHDRPLPQCGEQPAGQRVQRRDGFGEAHAGESHDRHGDALTKFGGGAFVQAQTGHQHHRDGRRAHPGRFYRWMPRRANRGPERKSVAWIAHSRGVGAPAGV